MSGPFGSSQWMYSSGGFYPQEIEQSLRFNDDDSAYLSRTPASAGNRKTWTWSGWVKLGKIGASGEFLTLFGSGNASTNDSTLAYGDTRLYFFDRATGKYLVSDAIYRDSSAWYHFVMTLDTTQASASDRIAFYVNGERITNFQQDNMPTLNQDLGVNNSIVHYIGARNRGSIETFFDGYMAEVNFIDGQALDPTDFGEFKSGVWVAKEYAGSYGTNGFYLPFKQTTVANGMNTVTYTGNGGTQSIKGVGFSPDLIWGKSRNNTFSHALHDSVRGFGNRLVSNDTAAESFRTDSITSVGADGFTLGSQGDLNYNGNTMVAWCWDAGSENNWAADFDGSNDDVTGTLASGIGTGDFTLEYWVRHDTLTDYQTHFSITRGSTGFNVGTDASGDMVWYSNSARQLETIGAISTGTWYHWAFVRSSGTLKSYLNGVEQDSVSNTENFSATAFSIGALDSGSEFSNCRISNLRLTNTAVYTANFTPPTSNLTAISGTILLTLQDGTFKDNSGNNTVVSGNNGVFLAQNNQNSENTDGSITSSVKSNPAYGFSVVSYTAAGSTATVGHGLGAEPSMIIIKNRTASSGYNWNVYHTSIGNTQRLLLDSTTAAISGVWNNTSPTSSVFTIGGSAVYDSGDYIAYCFAEISGYSSISSYSGTGASGNTITTGFKPAFVMVKRADSTSSWTILDNTRGNQNRLYANLSNAESTTPSCDFTDTGFELTDANTGFNASGGTYIYMAFADTRDAAFWRDLSGNDNTWQPNYLQNSDVMPDSPTNNFATLNPNIGSLDNLLTYSEGNLFFSQAASSGNASQMNSESTFGFSSGKWYWEYANVSNQALGFSINMSQEGTYIPSIRGYYVSNGTIEGFGCTAPSSGAAWTSSDVISFAFDADNGTLAVYKNNSLQGTFTNIPVGNTYFARTLVGSSHTSGACAVNFGQDSSFAGGKTPQGNTDDNGVGDFYYAPPSGYLALCTANLPDPVIDPAKDDVPSDYFTTVLTTGDGTNATISGFGFQPDFLWHKSRSTANNHQLMDLIRVDGSGNPTNLVSNLTNADGTSGVVTFTSDGYTHLNGGSNNFYGSGVTYVDWAWKAGNGTSSNTDGSITSTVSVNQKAGFSVVSYTGTGSAATFGHGIGAAPSMVIIKDRDNGTKNWTCYHEAMGNDRSIFLNLTNAQTASTDHWQYTNPSSSVVYIGDYSHINTSGNDYICYAFAEVEGYSKFGSYTGNGSTDGPFVFTSFRPSWVMVKRTDGAGGWNIHDNTRNAYNPEDLLIRSDTSSAETTGGATQHDFTSNGFKLRTVNTDMNASGGTYIYMAFAENPFKYANAR